MNIQTEFFNTELLFNSRKAGKSEKVKVESLPLASLLAVAQYGAQRFINDKLGGTEIGQAEAAKKFDEIMTQLRAGWVGRQSSGGVGRTPLEAEIYRLARAAVRSAIQAKGLKLKDIEAKQLESLIVQYIERHKATLQPMAQAAIDAASSLESLSLDGLGL